MHARAETAASWPEEIFSILQRFEGASGAHVPDAGHSELIERVLGSSSMRGIALTTEEEGVALLAGAWAGGQRGVLLMQSSGVGNCINMLVAGADLPSAVPHAGDDARRMGRVQSSAGADGLEHARHPRTGGDQGAARLRILMRLREVVEAGAAQATTPARRPPSCCRSV